MLDVEIVLDDRDIDLIEAGIDVALRIGRLGDSGTTVRKIGHCRSCVVGTPSYFAAHGPPEAPGDLIEHQVVIYEQRAGGPTWTFRQGTTEMTVTVRARLRVSAADGRASMKFAVGQRVPRTEDPRHLTGRGPSKCWGLLRIGISAPSEPNPILFREVRPWQ